MKRLISAFFLVVLCICAPHVTAQIERTPVPNRVLGRIDETQLVTLEGSIHPLASVLSPK
jgi:hypothetical protein